MNNVMVYLQTIPNERRTRRTSSPWQLFTTCSRAVSQCTGTAMFCYSWLSTAVLYRDISRFLARLFFTEIRPAQPEDSPIPCSRHLFRIGRGSGNLSICPRLCVFLDLWVVVHLFYVSAYFYLNIWLSVRTSIYSFMQDQSIMINEPDFVS